MRGNPRCESCHGRGGFRDGFGWRKCHCMRTTKEQAEIVRRFNQRDDRPFQLALDLSTEPGPTDPNARAHYGF